MAAVLAVGLKTMILKGATCGEGYWKVQNPALGLIFPLFNVHKLWFDGAWIRGEIWMSISTAALRFLIPYPDAIQTEADRDC
jgi:hypothetical protein